MQSTISQWRIWQESQALSERTISERAAVITHLMDYAGASALTLTPDDIIAYTARREISAASKGTYHATIRAYCAWLVRTGLREDDPSARTPRPKRPKGQPRPVADSALAALLEQVNRRRTKMMILLAALAGLRVHEIAKIHGHDIDMANGLLTVTGKGNKTACLPLHPDILAEAAKFPPDGYWFPSYAKQGTSLPHIKPSAVSASIMKTMRRAGVPGKAHQLRHWYATTLLGAGVDLRIVQELMRHESPATTAIYTQVDFRQQREGMNRLALPRAA